MEEDTALRVHRDEQTKEFVISGTGQLHVEVAVERLKRKFGVEVELKAPKVPYKETIKGTRQGAGEAQEADRRPRPVRRRLASSSRRCRAAAGFEFEDAIVGGVDPAAVHPRGREGRPRAAAAGHPRRLPDRRRQGEALRRLGTTTSTRRRWRSRSPRRLGFKKAFEQCKPVLLEPIMTITVTVPDEYMGDIIGDLNSRRGKVLGAEPKGNGQQVIKAHVPMSEVLRYAPDLRSMTSGRGDFELEFWRTTRRCRRTSPSASSRRRRRRGPSSMADARRAGRGGGGGGRGGDRRHRRARGPAEGDGRRGPRGAGDRAPRGAAQHVRADPRHGRAGEDQARAPRQQGRAHDPHPRQQQGRPPPRPAESAHQRPEIVAVARSKNSDEELLRIIGDKREWARLYRCAPRSPPTRRRRSPSRSASSRRSPNATWGSSRSPATSRQPSRPRRVA